MVGDRQSASGHAQTVTAEDDPEQMPCDATNASRALGSTSMTASSIDFRLCRPICYAKWSRSSSTTVRVHTLVDATHSFLATTPLVARQCFVEIVTNMSPRAMSTIRPDLHARIAGDCSANRCSTCKPLPPRPTLGSGRPWLLGVC
jgi:hypothetical protein